MSRRVLFVTSLWPPLAFIGVRRVVRLARHLPACGWTPVILTDAPHASGYPWAPPMDPVAVAPPVEVHRAAGLMLAPRARRMAVAALKASRVPKADWAFHRLTQGLVLPDHYPAWTAAAVRAARRVPAVDAVWATGRPFGMFVVAAAVARALGKPLVLDYRDPWSLDIEPDRVPLRWPRAAHAALEGALLRRAAGVAFVNDDILARYEAAFPKPAGADWRSIPNGFDRAEYADVVPHRFDRPTALYTGSFYGARSLAPVLDALATGWGPGTEGLQVQVYGELDPAGAASLARRPLPGRVHVQGRVPASAIMPLQAGADALLLAVGPEHRTALTGKVFDYVCAGRPILGYGPADADAGALVRDAGLGAWVDAADTDGLVAALRQVEAGTLPYAPRPEALHGWSAEAMAERTAALLDSVS